MTLNYNNLSAGYIGETCTNSTWNSQYYNIFLNETYNQPKQLNNILLIPQRIPKAGFFEELYALETPEYQIHFDKVITTIKHSHKIALEILMDTHSEENARSYINWSNILLRYGCFEYVISHFPIDYSGSFSVEIEIFREFINIEFLLSQDKPISIDYQLQLAEKFLHSDNTTDREKLILLNQMVVNYYRHQKETHNHKKIFQLCQFLFNLINQFESTDFINSIYCSVAYRGLAMAHDFGHEMQNNFMDKAEELARQLPWKTQIEKIIASENLFTCIQTLSKWSLYNNNIEKAENYFHELTIIDPYDSTGYSEIGFFYIKAERYENAAKNFKKAMELGPPGTGMNAYFYASCLEKLGREKEFIEYLYEATRLDKQAISPWLDLMNHYINQKLHNKASQIANFIYQSPTLFEQLEEDETITIQNLI